MRTFAIRALTRTRTSIPLYPGLTSASTPLFGEVEVLDELGRVRHVYIPGECPLMVYLDRHGPVMLTTLGGAPEVLVLDYLRSQRLVSNIEDITSTQVDWETESAIAPTRAGIADLDEKVARRTVTTDCG